MEVSAPLRPDAGNRLDACVGRGESDRICPPAGLRRAGALATLRSSRSDLISAAARFRIRAISGALRAIAFRSPYRPNSDERVSDFPEAADASLTANPR
jgi:hypothetical protein